MKLIRFSFVIVACLWLSCGTIEERRRQVEQQQVKQAVENQEYSSASVQEQQVKSTKQNTNTTEIKAENPTNNNKKTTTENNTKYYVVVGSFSRVEEAKELYSQLVDNKYSCDILTTENGYHRVVLGSYINRDEARNAKDLFAAAYEDVEPWILTQ